jgi:16S rRNA processing protein RimM
VGTDRHGPEADVIIVGQVASPYGVKGWVRISSFTDPAENILEYRPWLLRQAGVWREVALEACEVRGTAILAHFAGCRTRDDAAALRGSEIAVQPDRLPELAEGEYYWRQLVGLVVTDLAGRRLGRVERVMETGANDVLVVRGDEESPDQRERLIPFLQGRVIREVDLDRGSIQVDWDAEF